MLIRSCIRRLFQPRRALRPQARPRARLAVEALESRTLLSTIVVNNFTDTAGAGETDLRQAIAQANAAGGDETIVFDTSVSGLPQTINLTGGPLELSDTTGTESIVGPGFGLTINGGGLSGVFEVDAGVTASISGLTITGGATSDSNGGGGVFNAGTLTLTGVTVTGNSATAALALGGGISNAGALTLTDSVVSDNSVTSTSLFEGAFGAGIYNYNVGSMDVVSSTISGNSIAAVPADDFSDGGGVANFGKMTIDKSLITFNSARDHGGGVDNFSSFYGSITITNSILSFNSAEEGGGFYNFESTATMTNDFVIGNVTKSAFASPEGFGGAGVYNDVFGTLTINSSLISGNVDQAGFGGAGGAGVHNDEGSYLTVNQSIIIGNIDQGGSGGGLDNSNNSTATVTNSTIAFNTTTGDGGGIDNQGQLTVNHSAILGNSAGTTGGGISATFSSVTITDSTIRANVVDGTTALGGGIYASSSSLTVQNSTIIGNAAIGSQLGEGGGIYNSGSDMTLTSSFVIGNKASTSFNNIFNS